MKPKNTEVYVMSNRNKGCGKFKCSVSIVGGWCGMSQRVFSNDVYYCKECIRKFVKQYNKRK